MYPKIIIITLLLSINFACNNKHSANKKNHTGQIIINKKLQQNIKHEDTLNHRLRNKQNYNFKDEDLVDISLLSDKFIIAVRYASKNNFLDTVLYPCSKCLLRFEVAKDLLKAEKEFEKYGYRIKLYDCYRPLHVQKLMWKKLPVKGLVADPATGSRHNRGSAVDISLIDTSGKELDFGTPHDDFSEKARTFYPLLSDTIKANRMFMRKIMKKHNFTGINSEWWHFKHNCGTKYPLSDKNFDCDSVQ
ncbi:MAG: M15 family metallopeptidase [Chlorobi bacterium]|nr:M15 family metallopeptidase [Chlorobiota bacterium]